VCYKPLSGLHDELTESIKLQQSVAGIMESKFANHCWREMWQIHMARCPQTMQREWD
jgi:hypothetical protein